jgi:hypothetical protein
MLREANSALVIDNHGVPASASILRLIAEKSIPSPGKSLRTPGG